MKLVNLTIIHLSVSAHSSLFHGPEDRHIYFSASSGNPIQKVPSADRKDQYRALPFYILISIYTSGESEEHSPSCRSSLPALRFDPPRSENPEALQYPRS